MRATTFANNAMLDFLFGSNPSSPSGGWYVGLSTTNIDDNGGGVKEPLDAEYSRQQITSGSTNWELTSASAITNRTKLNFAQSVYGWGIIQEVFLATSSIEANTGSYIWYHDDINPSIPIGTYTTLNINPGTIIVTHRE